MYSYLLCHLCVIKLYACATFDLLEKTINPKLIQLSLKIVDAKKRRTKH